MQEVVLVKTFVRWVELSRRVSFRISSPSSLKEARARPKQANGHGMAQDFRRSITFHIPNQKETVCGPGRAPLLVRLQGRLYW